MNKTAFLRGYMSKEAGAKWRSWLADVAASKGRKRAAYEALEIMKGGRSRIPMTVASSPGWTKVRRAMTDEGMKEVSDKEFVDMLRKATSEFAGGGKPVKLSRRGLRSAARLRNNGLKAWPDAVNKIDPEGYVNVVHTGSADYINDFVRGRVKGYPLETGGTGLQVHPVRQGGAIGRDRALYYGNAAHSSYGVDPGIMTGRIKAKYLTAANNGYEAGLTPEGLKHLEDIKTGTYKDFDWNSAKSILQD